MAFSVLCLSYCEGTGHLGGMSPESGSCCLMASQAWAASVFACFTYAPAFGAGEGKQEAVLRRAEAPALGLQLSFAWGPPLPQLCSLSGRRFLVG